MEVKSILYVVSRTYTVIRTPGIRGYNMQRYPLLSITACIEVGAL